jgi:hypothetical protein
MTSNAYRLIRCDEGRGGVKVSSSIARYVVAFVVRIVRSSCRECLSNSSHRKRIISCLSICSTIGG